MQVRHRTGNSKACPPRLSRRRRTQGSPKRISRTTLGFQDAIRHQQRGAGNKQVDDQNRKDCSVPACRPAPIRRGGRVEVGEKKRENTRNYKKERKQDFIPIKGFLKL